MKFVQKEFCTNVIFKLMFILAIKISGAARFQNYYLRFLHYSLFRGLDFLQKNYVNIHA